MGNSARIIAGMIYACYPCNFGTNLTGELSVGHSSNLSNTTMVKSYEFLKRGIR